MEDLQIFKYNELSVRTVQIGGEPWFVLKDVCDVLGIGNSRMVLDRLEDDEKGVSQIDTLGGKQNLSVINESGLYNVILRSDKPEAKPFRKWVTSEVLPSIRKTGGYQQKALTTAQMFAMQAQVNLEQEQRLTALETNQVEMHHTMQQAFSELTIPAAPRDHWQDAMCKKIRQLCMEHELNFQTFTGQLYKELEESAHVNIETRRKRLRERMKRGGAKSAECQAISKLAVVSQDPKLREIFSALVQRRAAALVSARISAM